MCQTRLLFRGLSEYNGHCAVDLEPESVVRRKTMPDRRDPAVEQSPEELAERRAYALAEHGTDLPLILTPEAEITYVGPSIEPLFGYRADDVLGRSGWDFVHPDDAPAKRE